MPKRQTLILIALATAICLTGQNIHMNSGDTRSFSAGFRLGDFEMEINQEYSSILIDDIGWASVPGEPELPIASEYILMSDMALPEIIITFASTETLFAPPPNPTDVPMSESGELSGVSPGESPIYNSSKTFPESIIEIKP
ncbi:MAG TPA: hypothetical protein ENN75_00360, partial [candidate division Zixibacteria bacterium]|nr:hypothetical protein [candidate division Zixibacteria bacterium]